MPLIETRKLFNSIKKWDRTTPIFDSPYRYSNHATIYKTSTSILRPSERQVLVHRYLHRKLKYKIYRFYVVPTITYRYNNEAIEPPTPHWIYGMIMSIAHENTFNTYGQVTVSYYSPTSGIETLEIGVNTQIVVEEVSEQNFQNIIDLFSVK